MSDQRPSEVVREAVQHAGFLGKKHGEAAQTLGRLLDDLDERVAKLEREAGDNQS